MLIGTDFGVAADFSGSFCIDNVPPGIYDAKAWTVGYRKVFAESLEVAPDSISIQNFELEDMSVELADLHIRADRNIVAHYPACEK